MDIMLSKKSGKIYWPIVILLLIQTIVSSEIFWIIGALLLIYSIVTYHGLIILPFKEYIILIIFLFWGIIISLFNNFQIIDFIRDIFYYTSPLIFIYLGIVLMRKRISIYSVLNAFIIFSSIISVLALLKVAQNFSTLITSSYVGDWRNEVGNGDTTLAITLAVILSGIIPNQYRINKYLYNFSSIICGLYFILTLSRTILLAIVIIFLCLAIKKNNYKTIKKILTICIVLGIAILILFFILPKSITEQFIAKFISSLSEISFNHKWDSVAEIQANWRGYESYCAIKQWQQYNLLNQLFGAGFGERIYVGDYAFLFLNQVDAFGRPIDTIAVLHNGYAMQLVKLGIIGTVLYLLFYILIIRRGIKSYRQNDTIEARLLIGVGFELLFQTYFLNGLYKDTCFFALVILIGYAGQKCYTEYFNKTNNRQRCSLAG